MRVPEPVTALRKKLGDSGLFHRVGHARAQVSQDESEPIPEVLTFYYRGAQFFAKVAGAEVFLTVPSGGITNPPAGMVNLDDPDLVHLVARLLNEHVCPAIVLTSDGDTMVFPAQADDTTTLGNFNVGTHDYCGGCLDRTQISAGNAALHCRKCNLRIVVPLDINTIGGLREYTVKQGFASQGEG